MQTQIPVNFDEFAEPNLTSKPKASSIKKLLFYCTYKKFIGFIFDKSVYIFHYNQEDETKVDDPSYIYKMLNSKNLKNIFVKNDNQKDEYTSELSNFVEYHGEFENYKIYNLYIPPPKDIDIRIKKFSILFFNTIELKNYSKIHVLKSLNLRYHFKVLSVLKPNLTEQEIHDYMINNIQKKIISNMTSITKKLNKHSLNINLLSYYIDIISPITNYNIINIYVSVGKIKKLLELHDFLIKNVKSIENIESVYLYNKEEIDNKAKKLLKLLYLYYRKIADYAQASSSTTNRNTISSIYSGYYSLSEVYNKKIEKEFINDSDSNISDNTFYRKSKLISEYYISVSNLVRALNSKANRRALNSKASECERFILDNNTMCGEDYGFLDVRIIEDELFKIHIAIRKFPSTFILFPNIFKLKLFEMNIKQFILFLYVLKKENSNMYHSIFDTIEKTLLVSDN